MEMYRESLSYLSVDGAAREDKKQKEEWEVNEKRKDLGIKRVKEWEKNAQKAKL